MRIRIESIEAELINSSTPTYDEYLLRRWKVEYSVEFTGGPSHSIAGKMDWLEVPDTKKILDFLRERYSKL